VALVYPPVLGPASGHQSQREGMLGVCRAGWVWEFGDELAHQGPTGDCTRVKYLAVSALIRR